MKLIKIHLRRIKKKKKEIVHGVRAGYVGATATP
jgi:hypothetical protein